MEEKKVDGRGGARAGSGRPKGIKTPYKRISLNLPEEYSVKLKQAAAKMGLSQSKFIQLMVDRALEED